MKTKVRKIISFILAAGIMSCVPFAACSVTSERYDGQNNGTINGGENGGSTSGGDNGNVEEDIPQVERQIYLDELDYTYASTGYGSLSVNAGSDGNKLSLYKGGNETEHDHGFFAHAYSVISYDDIATLGFTQFSAYIGINKTARVAIR